MKLLSLSVVSKILAGRQKIQNLQHNSHATLVTGLIFVRQVGLEKQSDKNKRAAFDE